MLQRVYNSPTVQTATLCSKKYDVFTTRKRRILEGHVRMLTGETQLRALVYKEPSEY